jgi:hypothetical protein
VFEGFNLKAIGVKPPYIVIVKGERWPLHLVLRVSVGDE